MSISFKGFPKTLIKQLDSLPKLPGVYLYFSKENKILYVGKAIRLKDRVTSYFQNKSFLGPKTQKMVSLINHIDHIVTDSEMEALILEADLIKRYKPPFNIQWKDDKAYKYIKIQIPNPKSQKEERWPQVTTSRRQDDPKAYYFGPFPQGRTVNEVLKTLRHIFPWCKYSHPPRDGKPCFYYHLGLCPGVCAHQIDLVGYRRIVRNLIKFLKGGKYKIILGMGKEMKKAAKNNNFETAAFYRDKIKNLNYVVSKFHGSRDYIENPNLVQDERIAEIAELIKILGLPSQIPSDFRIEGFDISNLSGKMAVGSMVVATDGVMDKKEYRRFKMKKDGSPNDFAMMREMLARRFSPSKQKSRWILPHLIMVDGGASQLSQAYRVVLDANLRIPVIGLAKKMEEIYVPATVAQNLKTTNSNTTEYINYSIIRLPRDSKALHLLQRIRDEAHRFAIGYHRSLRRIRLQSIIKKV